MEQEIKQMCEELCCKEIECDEQLIISGLLDSFKLMELICSLEERYDILFLPQEISELDHFSTVEQICSIIRQKQGI